MIEYAGLNGRNQLVNDLADKFETQTAFSVTFIHARCGQGKSYIVNHIIKKLEASEKIKVYCSCTTVKSPLWNDKERKVPAGGCFLAITAQSDEQIQAAWEFEKYLYSVESMAAWTEGTGYVPPRKDVAEAENGLKDFLAENTMMNAAIEQMDGVVSWTAFPGDAGLEAEQLLLDMRDQILGGQVSAKDGMTSTQDAINQLLDAQ